MVKYGCQCECGCKGGMWKRRASATQACAVQCLLAVSAVVPCASRLWLSAMIQNLTCPGSNVSAGRKERNKGANSLQARNPSMPTAERMGKTGKREGKASPDRDSSTMEKEKRRRSSPAWSLSTSTSRLPVVTMEVAAAGAVAGGLAAHS